MAKREKYTKIKKMLNKKPPTPQGLLTPEELAYFKTICPNWAELKQGGLSSLIYSTADKKKAARIKAKLDPMKITFAMIPVEADWSKRRETPGSVSPEGAEAIKGVINHLREKGLPRVN